MTLSKPERLALCMKKLEESEPVSNMEDAYELLCNSMNSIEDTHSGVPYDPGNYIDDGRLYPPLKDNRFSIQGREDVVRYRSRGHNIFLSSEGGIKIQTSGKHGQGIVVYLNKPGKSGKYVEI